MLKYLLPLEWKAFLRSASFKVHVAMRILAVLGALYFIGIFLVLGMSSYYLLEENNLAPFETINKYLIYYFTGDLMLRFFFQKPPTANIRPLLLLNIRRKRLIQYFLGKTIVSIFNGIHFFFILPFCGVLIFEGFPVQQVLFWGLSLLFLVYCMNFLNLLINIRPVFFYSTIAVLLGCGLLQYYQIYDITLVTAVFFKSFYDFPLMLLFSLGLLLLLYKVTLNYYLKNLYLDAGLSEVKQEAKSEDFSWLDRFGSVSVFLKNDLKMILRNKRPKTTVLMSVAFVFYGLLFFTNSIDVYSNDFMYAFSGIFVTGGFLLTFGQYVPSWDSSYYALMMCQNIKYRDYLKAKWWLMVIATALSLVLSSFYLYFGWQIYMMIIATAIFNMGVNSYLVLWGGAFVKTPIDLGANKNIMGDKQAFNLKTLLISLPKMLIPMILYGAVKMLWGFEAAVISLAAVGLFGFAFRNVMFDKIERIYRSEKYDTLKAYKQKN